MNMANTLVSNVNTSNEINTSMTRLLMSAKITEVNNLDAAMLSLVGGGDNVVCW